MLSRAQMATGRQACTPRQMVPPPQKMILKLLKKTLDSRMQWIYYEQLLEPQFISPAV